MKSEKKLKSIPERDYSQQCVEDEKSNSIIEQESTQSACETSSTTYSMDQVKHIISRGEDSKENDEYTEHIINYSIACHINYKNLEISQLNHKLKEVNKLNKNLNSQIEEI